MQCPHEITKIICDILRTGLLRIRCLRDPDRSAVEADHLHNLPGLLADYKPELLDYYWSVERVSFMQHSNPEELCEFEPLWTMLAEHVQTSLPEARCGARH